MAVKNVVEAALVIVESLASQLPEGESPDIRCLRNDLRLLKLRLRCVTTFCVCGRMWGKVDQRCESTLLSIEDTVEHHLSRISGLCNDLRRRGNEDSDHNMMTWDYLHTAISGFISCISGPPFRQKMRELYLVFSNASSSVSQAMRSEDSQFFVIPNGASHCELSLTIDSLVQNLQVAEPLLTFLDSYLLTGLYCWCGEIASAVVHSNSSVCFKQIFLPKILKKHQLTERIPYSILPTLGSPRFAMVSHDFVDDGIAENARFLNNLFSFARARGLSIRQMQPLLAFIQAFLAEGARQTFMLSFIQDFDDHISLPTTSRRMRNQQPSCKIFVGILQASKLSLPISHHHFTPVTQRLILRNFVDSLLDLLWKLLSHCTGGHRLVFKPEMHKLHGGLTFLTNIMTECPSKFDELDDKIHVLIGLVICDAGIAVIHLHEKEEGKSSLVTRLEILFSNLQKNLIKLIQAVQEDAQKHPLSLASDFSQTNLLCFIDSVLGKMKLVGTHDADSMKAEIQTLHDDLTYLRSSVVMLWFDNNGKFQAIRSRIAAALYETNYALDSLAVGNAFISFIIKRLNNRIERIKEAVRIYLQSTVAAAETGAIFQTQNQLSGVAETCSKIPSAADQLSLLNDGIGMVGLDDEVTGIIDRLIGGTKRLDIVSIVGMPGIGKTTFAKKVFTDPSIASHFWLRSWGFVSQAYDRRSLLLQILSGLDYDFAAKCSQESTEDDLANVVRKYLKGRRYLIILDDVWDSKTWDTLRTSFPDDANGSRIMLTSRHHIVASEIKPDREPYSLRFLNEDESWEVMQKKICLRTGYPPELLTRQGKAIAHKCNGLPLMISVLAGLLSNMEPDAWGIVEEKLKKGTLSIIEKCRATIELSYSHLPGQLKQCFLYFGAFPENKQVPVRKLLWLWMAEGIVEENGIECAEDIAESCMRELMERNLVMVVNRGSRGAAKSCMIHDLLHEFCVEKCNEEHFLHHLRGCELGTCSVDPSTLHRMYLEFKKGEDFFAKSRLICPRLRALFMVAHLGFFYPRHWYSMLCRFKQSKLLIVLDLERVNAGPLFPEEVIESLVHLRYLALKIQSIGLVIPSSIANLSNLETFIIQTLGQLLLPHTFWSMKNLKHLRVGAQFAYWVLPNKQHLQQHSEQLPNVHTISSAMFRSGRIMLEVMRKFPNIRRLKYSCRGLKSSSTAGCEILALDFMTQLESLTIASHLESFNFNFQFPRNLKKLTLSRLRFPWSKISAVDKLPNLEALKLLADAFSGENWDVKEGTFPKLRFLRLAGLDLVRWTNSSDDVFPCLRELVLERCEKLKELPSCFDEIPTLEVMKVTNCVQAVDSTKQIQAKQRDWGNGDLNVIVQTSV
ncbi:OLC1v1007479C1 [Oldenlandia corymbosa var. corymbosa]|uniref:OLC1v1007479C1 n=1 Tax=Oldenlandia corymbosa var. corymbosa TaxID=529605 RepID=A0AAV1DJD6_OLDCO|nr:OLC1v1007479C1 [Oldenlandia corymbosa var. corymbosa]